MNNISFYALSAAVLIFIFGFLVKYDVVEEEPPMFSEYDTTEEAETGRILLGAHLYDYMQSVDFDETNNKVTVVFFKNEEEFLNGRFAKQQIKEAKDAEEMRGKLKEIFVAYQESRTIMDLSLSLMPMMVLMNNFQLENIEVLFYVKNGVYSTNINKERLHQVIGKQYETLFTTDMAQLSGLAGEYLGIKEVNGQYEMNGNYVKEFVKYTPLQMKN